MRCAARWHRARAPATFSSRGFRGSRLAKWATRSCASWSRRPELVSRLLAIAAAACLAIWGGAAAAQETVHFPSAEDNGADQPSTLLDGYLFRASGDGPHSAIVGLHGCSGMFGLLTGSITGLYRQWAAEFNR